MKEEQSWNESEIKELILFAQHLGKYTLSIR